MLNIEENTIYITRGDSAVISVSAKDDNGNAHVFQSGDVVRLKVFAKKDTEKVVFEQYAEVTTATDTVTIGLSKTDTKRFEVVNKPTDYWYEVELNPGENPQTIIGYDGDGAKVLRLFPEGGDVEEDEPIINPEDIPVVDSELDLTSKRPVENMVIARAIYRLQGEVKGIPNTAITPQMFGAMGDGIKDDTVAILKAIENLGNGCSKLYFPAGTYLVSEDIPLVSNITVEGEGHNTIIKRVKTDIDNYNVLLCEGLENVTIKNIHIQGERDEHTGTEGEWGMCLGIRGCNNITVESCKLSKGWGDGIYVGSSGDICCNNIIIDNCVIDANRRNGISVINCVGLIVRNSRLTNTSGTEPQSGIDFEANSDIERIADAIVDNCYFKGNNKSVLIGNAIIPYEITVTNCSFYDTTGVYIPSTTDEDVKGFIDVRNCVFRCDKGVLILGKSVSGLKVYVSHCDFYCTTICVDYNTNTDNCVYGGLYMVGCNIYDNSPSYCPIRVINKGESSSYSDMILDLTISSNVKRAIYFQTKVPGECLLKINGKRHTFGGTTNLDQFNVYTELDLNPTSAITLNCQDTFPYGVPVKIRNIGSQNISVAAQNGDFRPFGMGTFTLGGNYNEIILVHEAAGIWSVVNNTYNGITV